MVLIQKKLTFFAYICLILGAISCGNTEKVKVKNEDGSTIEFYRNKKNNAKEGKFTKLSAEGVKLEEASYKNDTLDGERRLYYESGAIQTIEQYKRGNFEGLLQSFYPNGKVEIEELYSNNAINGQLKHYYDNGQLMELVMMKDNEESGPFIEYHKNGKLKAEGTYRDGDHEDGELKLYNENGELYKTMNCMMGLCRTAWLHADSTQVIK